MANYQIYTTSDSLGVHTLAFGHYQITKSVNDTTPIHRSGENMVLSAEEAARDLIRPGRPWPHHFPIGEDTVTATHTFKKACSDAAKIRLRDAQLQIHNGQWSSSKTQNSALVNSIVSSILDEQYRGAIDFDFDVDDIVALHETAVNFRNTGISNDDLREHMLDLTGALREMLKEEMEDGEITEDAE